MKNKTGLPDFRVIEGMNRLGLTIISSIKKVIELCTDKIICLIIIKTIKIKSSKTKVFEKKVRFDNDLCIETTSY